MILLHVLRGSSAGVKRIAEKFPFTIGRDSRNSLSIPDAGVFDRHLEILFSADGYSVVPQRDAVLTVNGDKSETCVLKNGDVLGLGIAQVQFSLGPLPQRSLRLREVLTWLLVAGVVAAQVYYFWRLLMIARS
jgi:pSer/pThr/pTyr-binding forkhead associated (FHA) protein